MTLHHHVLTVADFVDGSLLYASHSAVVDADTLSSHSQNHVLSITHDRRNIDHTIKLVLVNFMDEKQLSISFTNTCINRNKFMSIILSMAQVNNKKNNNLTTLAGFISTDSLHVHNVQ